uniref:Uncharacterized protein n=1 Tax=Tetraselmis chuii TaxID=63592 RepID=A0A7S1X2X6_9CHLO|mmetsp:Transcript_26736/g.47604  ORF Transcript_26736/g.47604 Transcript_26736/m.47604 type:complete len:259 (+) Transcript_26736:70-846(+)
MSRSQRAWYGLCHRGFAALEQLGGVGRTATADSAMRASHHQFAVGASSSPALVTPAEHLLTAARHHLAPLAQGIPASSGWMSTAGQRRGMAQLPFKLPPGKMPKRPSAADSVEKAAASESNNPEPPPRMTPQQVTNMMYMPWEKRQFEGGALKWWEKAYWVVFLVTVGALGVSRMYNPWAPPIPGIDEDLEARKKEVARAVLIGQKHFLDDDDPFEGMEPTELDAFIRKQTGANIDDPFEGMTPEEIDEYMKNNAATQ